MKHRLGDTIRKELPTVFEALDEEGMNRQLVETLIWMHGGAAPKASGTEYELVTLTIQEMVDEANAAEEKLLPEAKDGVGK